MKKGIIFDFDGVIVESEPIYINSLVEYFKRINITTSFDEIKFVVGQNMIGIAKALIDKFSLDISIEQFLKDSTDVYNEMCSLDRFELMPGVLDFLNKCKDKGIKMCVASSSDYDYLITIIKNNKIEEYFEFVLSGAELEHSKPDPEIYNMAIEKLNLKKEEAIIIEDSYNGISAGVASGIYTYGLKASIVEQNTSLADKEIYSFEEIDI